MPPGAWEPAALPIWSMFRPCSFDSSSHPGAPPLEDFALAVASNLMLSGPQARRLSPSARASPCRSFVPPAPLWPLSSSSPTPLPHAASYLHANSPVYMPLPYRRRPSTGRWSPRASAPASPPARAPRKKRGTALLLSARASSTDHAATPCSALPRSRSKTSSHPPAPAPPHLPLPLPFLSRRLRLRLVEARELLRRRPQERRRA